jgi:mitotic spindle assembly checkpoint protein MAD2B
MSADTLKPPTSQDPPKHHEPLLHVKAVETGVIDVSVLGDCLGEIADGEIRLMVQECVAKTGVEHLDVT